MRPLAVAIIAALIVQIALSLTLRSAERGTVAAVVVVGAVIDVRLGLIISALLLAAYLMRQRLHKVSARTLALPTLLLLVIALVRATSAPAFEAGDLLGAKSAAAREPGNESPDIHLILLDGYPRADTLASWGYDNTWFEQELANRGFLVDSDSHGHYTQTSLVLPTMLHMRHVVDIPALSSVPRDTGVQKRAIRNVMRDAPAVEFLRELGYRIVTAGFPRSYITLPDAEVIDHGRLVGFERQVLFRSSLRSILPGAWLAAEQRALVHDAFSDVAAVAKDGRGPTFMLTHVISPHTPVVFRADGEPTHPSCLPACDLAQVHYERLGLTVDEFGSAYAAQTHYINGRVLEALDDIISASPDAVVVVFSDHGSRTELEDYSEWFRTLFAARTPGHDDLFADDGRAITIMARVLNAYFGTDHPIPADGRHWVTPDGTWPLSIEEWP